MQAAIYICVIFFELLALNLITTRLTTKLFKICYKITKDKKKSIYILSLIFLPGTFIHEAAHFLAALFLLVPVGEINLIPEVTDDSRIKMGSLPIAKTDVFRRFLIGTAPFTLGSGIILFIIYGIVEGLFGDSITAKILFGFIIFQISSTMFLSPEDLKGAFELLVLVLISALTLFSFGPAPYFASAVSYTDFGSVLIEILETSTIYLLLPILIDTLFLAVFKLLNE